jgi:hypoxanthine phosphoribosyltransferase
MEKLISQAKIAHRVKRLAKEISKDHIQSGNTLPPIMICILNGSIHFFSDLIRAMKIDCEIDFIRLKSYKGQDNSGGIQVLKGLELELKGRRAYIVDDICDSGSTLLEALFMCNSKLVQEVRVVTLLKRKDGVDMTDFCGFTIDKEWVVGYGLDNNGTQRELPHIYKLN